MRKLSIGIVAIVILGGIAGWISCKKSQPDPAEKNADRKILYYRNPMNPTVTSPVPRKDEMGMDYAPVYAEGTGAGAEAQGTGAKIDPAVVQKIGVVAEPVSRRILTRTIRASGTVDFNEKNLFDLNAKIMGWADQLYVNYTGQPVSKGQALFELYSPELVSGQEEYLQSLKYLRQVQDSSDPATIDRARQMAESAKRRLLYWDIPESEIKSLEKRGTPSKNLSIRSPAQGVVIEKMIVQGQKIEPGMELYKIADLTTVWVFADIYQDELAWVKLGQDAEISLSYLPGQKFSGAITYISPTLERESKTVKVRIEVKNTGAFDLKPGMFATVEIRSTLPEPALAAPEQSIIRSGERNLAVIALGNGYFEPREVTLGVSADGYVQILEGVSEGEQIVVSSQFLIDSESNLKAAVQQLSIHHQKAATPGASQPAPQSGQTPMELPPGMEQLQRLAPGGTEHQNEEHPGHQQQ